MNTKNPRSTIPLLIIILLTASSLSSVWSFAVTKTSNNIKSKILTTNFGHNNKITNKTKNIGVNVYHQCSYLKQSTITLPNTATNNISYQLYRDAYIERATTVRHNAAPTRQLSLLDRGAIVKKKGLYEPEYLLRSGHVTNDYRLDDDAIKVHHDYFNFKGGLMLHKSLLSREGFGVAFRFPISYHFNCFESRPWIPLLTSSCGLYFPFRGIFSLHASLPAAYLRYPFLTVADQMKFASTVIWYFISKTILTDSTVGMLILSSTGKRIGLKSKHYKNHSDRKILKQKGRVCSKIYSSSPLKKDLRYASSERIGISISWQYSVYNGVEVKCSWWHSIFPTILLPTIEHVGDMTVNLMKPYAEKTSFLASHGNWLRQKVRSLGFVWGGFAKEDPFYSNLALSLS